MCYLQFYELRFQIQFGSNLVFTAETFSNAILFTPFVVTIGYIPTFFSNKTYRYLVMPKCPHYMNFLLRTAAIVLSIVLRFSLSTEICRCLCVRKFIVILLLQSSCFRSWLNLGHEINCFTEVL